jgi:hypothetical protein
LVKTVKKWYQTGELYANLKSVKQIEKWVFKNIYIPTKFMIIMKIGKTAILRTSQMQMSNDFEKTV